MQRWPGKAGPWLTVTSLGGILALSVQAVPQGCARASREAQKPPANLTRPREDLHTGGAFALGGQGQPGTSQQVSFSPAAGMPAQERPRGGPGETLEGRAGGLQWPLVVSRQVLGDREETLSVSSSSAAVGEQGTESRKENTFESKNTLRILSKRDFQYKLS